MSTNFSGTLYADAFSGTMGSGFYEKIYYVDNVNGSANNTGETRGAPFAQLATAVTAWEAYRQTLANIYVRGAIIIRGTGTAYDPITALPNYCDIIGEGAEPRGDGTGIVVIAGTTEDAVAGSQRGNNWYNIQFKVTTDAKWCFDSVQSLRTKFENCAFMCAVASMATGGGFRMTGNSGGLEFHNCHWGSNAAGYLPYGIYGSSVTFNNCHIWDCTIGTVTCGIYLTGCTDSDTFIGPNNIIGGGSSVQTVTGIASGSNSLIAGNFITASSDAISGATAVNTINNQVINNATAARELA